MDTPVNDMTGPQLVARHNELARALGLPETRRFKSREAGVRRVAALMTDPRPPVEAPAAQPAPPADDRAAAAQEAIEAAADRSPTPPVRARLDPRGVPSADPAKDAEMPALRLNAQLMDSPPFKKVYARKAGSNQALIIDLMARPEGMTFGEMFDAFRAKTGKCKKGASMRSHLGWDVNRIAGYGIRSELLNGEQFAAQGRLYEAARLGMEAASVDARTGAVLRWERGPSYNPQVRLPVYRLTYPRGMAAPVPHAVRGGGQ